MEMYISGVMIPPANHNFCSKCWHLMLANAGESNVDLIFLPKNEKVDHLDEWLDPSEEYSTKVHFKTIATLCNILRKLS